MQTIFRIFQETASFFASLVRPSAKSIADNRGLFALSVILAFALWIFVTDAENPTRTRVLPIDIPVEPVDVPADVAIADDIQPVRVRVTVADDVFESLVATDFEATANLAGYGVGTHDEIPVEVTALHTRGGLRIESVLPDTVTVRLAQLASKSVPVDIAVTGTPAPGHSVGTPELEDDTVVVSGPQEEVDKVTQAAAIVDISSRTDTFNQAVRLSPRDSRGFLVQRVNLDPAIVDVMIGIEQEEFTRSLAIHVVTEGTPEEGYNVANVIVDPPTIVVRGDEAFIEDAFAINTQPIDIDGASDDIVRSVSLDLPRGVTVPGDAPLVTVTIEIEPGEAEFRFTVPVTVRNLDSSLSVEGAVPTVQVVLQGPHPILSEIEASAITAAIDLQDLGPGSHGVPVTVTEIPGVSSARALPATVQVVLEQN